MGTSSRVLELDDDLRGRSYEDLALAALLRIEDRAEAVVQHGNAHHGKRRGGRAADARLQPRPRGPERQPLHTFYLILG
eukprot:6214599-Pleurochrysis_carterae.AAC.2